MILVGVGDAFTHNKQHWVVHDIDGDKIICKNKVTGAIVSFDKEDVIKYIK